MQEAVIVAMGRSAIGKAQRGGLSQTRPEDFAAQVLSAVIDKVPAAKEAGIDDLVVGCSFPEAEQGLNLARILALKAGLGAQVPGQTVNRFCSSGLQAIATAANSIIAGENNIVVAGGVESMSMVPMGGHCYSPDPDLVESMPEAYMSMGLTAENVARQYRITREEQDVFAVSSHQKAWAARESGRFAQEIIPVQAVSAGRENGMPVTVKKPIEHDEGIRQGASAQALAKLRPVFSGKGSVTAGNSSQTSDGAAFVVLMSAAKAKELKLKPIARYVGYSVAGVAPEVMGIGPIKAIPSVLKKTGLTLADIDLIELNEAFAAQAIACIRELGLDADIVNVNGGAIALGHPLGCTGALLTVKLLHELSRRNQKYGIVSMCIGTGMGAASVFELL